MQVLLPFPARFPTDLYSLRSRRSLCRPLPLG